jgi:hypothetical protein
MVVGRNHRHAAFLRKPLRERLAVFGEAVVHHHFGAIALGGGDLGGRCVLGHDNHGRHRQEPRRQGDGLRVVARRKGDHATCALRRIELRERVEGAAELERAHALEVLALEEKLRIPALVGGGRLQHRGAVGMPLEPRGRGDHIVVGR